MKLLKSSLESIFFCSIVEIPHIVKYVFRFRYFLASFSANDDGDAETEAVEEAEEREMATKRLSTIKAIYSVILTSNQPSIHIPTTMCT